MKPLFLLLALFAFSAFLSAAGHVPNGQFPHGNTAEVLSKPVVFEVVYGLQDMYFVGKIRVKFEKKFDSIQAKKQFIKETEMGKNNAEIIKMIVAQTSQPEDKIIIRKIKNMHGGSGIHPNHPNHPGIPGINQPNHPNHPQHPGQPWHPGIPGINQPNHPNHPNHPQIPGQDTGKKLYFRVLVNLTGMYFMDWITVEIEKTFETPEAKKQYIKEVLNGQHNAELISMIAAETELPADKIVIKKIVPGHGFYNGPHPQNPHNGPQHPQNPHNGPHPQHPQNGGNCGSAECQVE